MKTYKWNREIWIDLDKIDLDEFNKNLAMYGIQIEYMLPGIMIHYNDQQLNLKLVPCDISFFSKTGILKLNIVESFGNLEFYIGGQVVSNIKPLQEYTEEEIVYMKINLELAKSLGIIKENLNIDKYIEKLVEERKKKIKANEKPINCLMLPIID